MAQGPASSALVFSCSPPARPSASPPILRHDEAGVSSSAWTSPRPAPSPSPNARLGDGIRLKFPRDMPTVGKEL